MKMPVETRHFDVFVLLVSCGSPLSIPVHAIVSSSVKREVHSVEGLQLLGSFLQGVSLVSRLSFQRMFFFYLNL